MSPLLLWLSCSLEQGIRKGHAGVQGLTGWRAWKVRRQALEECACGIARPRGEGNPALAGRRRGDENTAAPEPREYAQSPRGRGPLGSPLNWGRDLEG